MNLSIRLFRKKIAGVVVKILSDEDTPPGEFDAQMTVQGA